MDDVNAGLAEESIAQEERMVPQSKVNELVGAAKKAAAEKAYREAEVQFRSQSMGGMPPVVDTSKIVQEVTSVVSNNLANEIKEREKQYQEEERRKSANEFIDVYNKKLDVGRSRYDDFDAVVNEIDPKEFVDIIVLANEVDGTADVMYELAQDPDKLSRIVALSNRSEKQAKRLMQKLADSIKRNRDAEANAPQLREPLPKGNPSVAGTSTSGLKSVADFKRASWLRA